MGVVAPRHVGSSQTRAGTCVPFIGRRILFFFFLKKFTVLYLFIYLFIYLWLCWVFVSERGLSLVVASGGHSSSRCAGLSLSRPLPLRGTGSRHAGSVIVAHGPSCSVARGIFPDQGSNPCPLHWQADSQPLRHQGSPRRILNHCTTREALLQCILKTHEQYIRLHKNCLFIMLSEISQIQQDK